MNSEAGNNDNKVTSLILEDLQVLQSRIEGLEEDRQLLYKISQEQKERINEISDKIQDNKKAMTIFTMSVIVIAACVILLTSYLL